MARWLHTNTSKRRDIGGRMRVGMKYLLVACLLSLVTWCAGCGEKPQPKPVIKTLRIGSAGGPPQTLFPLAVDSTVSMALLQLVYNGLLKMNEEMSLIPDLAESWAISADGLAYTFHLRPNVRFHDGTELTAADVAFTYKLMKETPSFRQTCFSAIDRIELPDKYTIKVILSQPYGISVTALIEPILPKHLLEHADMTTSEFNHKPIGTGPFIVKEWTTDNRIILERNKDYYEDGPASGVLRQGSNTGDAPRTTPNARLARIEARGYETSSELFTALMKGETDLAFFLSQEQFGKVKDDDQFSAYQFPYIMTYAMEYNLEHPLFTDQTVRTALAHAINIPEMIKQIDGGYGAASTGPFIPQSWWFNPEVRPLEYDPARTQELLASAGWELNARNVLEKDGREFRFKVLVNRELRAPKRLGMLLYQDLFPLGIRVELADFDPAAYSEEKITIPPDAAAYPVRDSQDKAEETNQTKTVASGRPISNGAYLTYFYTMPDPAELYAYWDSRHRHPLIKLWSYENNEINNLFDLGRPTNQTSQRRQVYRELHRVLYDDQPALFMYSHYNLSAVRKGFDNTDKLFTPAMPFWTIKDWNIHHKDTKNTKEK